MSDGEFETVWRYISKYGTNEDPEQVDAWAAWDRVTAHVAELEARVVSQRTYREAAEARAAELERELQRVGETEHWSLYKRRCEAEERAERLHRLYNEAQDSASKEAELRVRYEVRFREAENDANDLEIEVDARDEDIAELQANVRRYAGEATDATLERDDALARVAELEADVESAQTLAAAYEEENERLRALSVCSRGPS